MDRLTLHTELLARSGGDPWVRWSLPDPLRGEVWVHQDIALVQRLGRRTGFWVAPLRGPGNESSSAVSVDASALASEAERVRSALIALRDGGHLRRLAAQVVSVVQEHSAVAHDVLALGDGGDWEWMSTTSAPPVDEREPRVITLSDHDDAGELTAFTRSHNPRVWTEIGTGRVRRWMGIRDGTNALVAIGGAEVEDTGIPHLAGIVTASTHRGHGLGRVISSSLTRWALIDHGACTLGMFSDNDGARRLYHRLGYRTARAWHSRALKEY